MISRFIVEVRFSMVSKADEVLRGIERRRGWRWFPIIGPEKGKILADVIRRHKPKRVLEVGTLVGYSAVVMGKELASDAEIFTIEIDEDVAKIARENIAKAEIGVRVEVLVGDALKVIPSLDKEFDMVFLDASKDEYLDYLKSVEDKLHKGTVIVADNAGASAWMMRDYLDYVRNSGKYESRLVRVGGDGMEISIKL